MSNKRILVLTAMLLVAFAGSFVMAASAVIESGDTIGIFVKGEPDLSVERIVGNDGSISLPLVGSVGVSGLKPADAAKVVSSMLEDGFLINPQVQVTLKSSKKADRAAAPVSEAFSAPVYEEPKTTRVVEIVDSLTGKGIGGSAVKLGNKIYQSNRLGQIVIESAEGHALILADGYKTFSGDLRNALTDGRQIKLKPVEYPESITFTVLDAATRKPLSNVEITLDGGRIKTNKKGEFKISQIKREFGEVSLKHRGYKPARFVVDYKGPETQQLFLVRND